MLEFPAQLERAHLPIVGGVWRALCWPAEWHGHLARGRAPRHMGETPMPLAPPSIGRCAQLETAADISLEKLAAAIEYPGSTLKRQHFSRGHERQRVDPTRAACSPGRLRSEPAEGLALAATLNPVSSRRRQNRVLRVGFLGLCLPPCQRRMIQPGSRARVGRAGWPGRGWSPLLSWCTGAASARPSFSTTPSLSCTIRPFGTSRHSRC